MKTPSAGALRAAREIQNHGFTPKGVVDVAKIIDTETGQGELLKALERIAGMEPGSRGAYSKFAEAVEISATAIKLAKGESS